MRNRSYGIIAAAAIAFSVVLLGTVGKAAVVRDPLMKPFEYDKRAPLNARWQELPGSPFYNLYKIVYESKNGEKVPALYYEAKPVGRKRPCIIMQHGYSGNKTDVKSFGLLDIVRAGYNVFAIDAQYHGERSVKGKDIFSADIGSDAKAIVQTVVDLRRGVDLLETRKEVDPKRISYIGVSMGGILGSIFAGVDQRVKAPVLVVGGGDWKTLVNESEIGPARYLRFLEKNGQIESVDKLAERMKYVEPLNHVWRISPRPVLFINNTTDKIVPVSTNKLLQAKAREPKKIVWLNGVPGDPTGHIPPLDKMISEALNWWKEKL